VAIRGRQTFAKELWIEVSSERSVHWYCGTAPVGIVAEFADERLESNYASWWSLDCL
jgi:hypothetical protein